MTKKQTDSDKQTDENATADSEAYLLKPTDLVTVTKMNHLIEIQYMQKLNRSVNILKLDKDRYLEISTGEVKEFQHSENRNDNHNSLRQTFKKLRYLINNNFIGAPNELHVTLTYAENMTDTKRLYKDFKNFVERLRTRFKKESTLDYLCVVEPQGRGAWHCHMLVRFNELEKVYIPADELQAIWNQGFVKIKSLKDVDNIGAYLSAYLTDVELTNDNMMDFLGKRLEVKEHEGKHYVKGGRLHMYPPGMNLYRKSKGIVFPEREKLKFEKIKKIVGSAKPHYEKTYKIEKENFENTIHFQQYNLKRK